MSCFLLIGASEPGLDIGIDIGTGIDIGIDWVGLELTGLDSIA